MVEQLKESTENTNNEKFNVSINKRQANILKKFQEQQEVRDMLNNYWPFSTTRVKPRGLRNLRMDGLFPNGDFMKAKRLVSPLHFKKSGGGDPIITRSGRKIIRTKEHPIIRFQLNNNLRKCIDNTFRYKADPDEKEIYRKQLEKQIMERKLKSKIEKESEKKFYQDAFMIEPPWGKPGPGGAVWRPPGNIGINFLKSLGWSTERMLKALDDERARYKETISKEYEKYKNFTLQPPNQVTKDNDQEKTKDSSTNYVKLSPIKKEIDGEEMVTLLAKQRCIPIKIPLCTTDVTKGHLEEHSSGSKSYLYELINQMDTKEKKLKKIKLASLEVENRHFDTLDSYWGKPGHGAPRSTIKKGCLDCLLYNFDHHPYCMS